MSPVYVTVLLSFGSEDRHHGERRNQSTDAEHNDIEIHKMNNCNHFLQRNQLVKKKIIAVLRKIILNRNDFSKLCREYFLATIEQRL